MKFKVNGKFHHKTLEIQFHSREWDSVQGLSDDDHLLTPIPTNIVNIFNKQYLKLPSPECNERTRF